MRKSALLPALLLCLATTGCTVQSVAVDGQAEGVHFSVSTYPDLMLVPGLPVYYAPWVGRNYFFYDGLYWVLEGDNWYASDWYNGPWSYVRIDYVPVYILRVPVYYYRRPPVWFRHGYANQPPRWGEHWGRDWEARHPEWHRRDMQSPAPAPRPDYQRHYRGRTYPAPGEQQELRRQHYHYQPRERVELGGARRPPEPWQEQQERWQQRRQEQQQQDREDQQRQEQQRQEQWRQERVQPGRGDAPLRRPDDSRRDDWRDAEPAAPVDDRFRRLGERPQRPDAPAWGQPQPGAGRMPATPPDVTQGRDGDWPSRTPWPGARLPAGDSRTGGLPPGAWSPRRDAAAAAGSRDQGGPARGGWRSVDERQAAPVVSPGEWRVAPAREPRGTPLRHGSAPQEPTRGTASSRPPARQAAPAKNAPGAAASDSRKARAWGEGGQDEEGR